MLLYLLFIKKEKKVRIINELVKYIMNNNNVYIVGERCNDVIGRSKCRNSLSLYLEVYIYSFFLICTFLFFGSFFSFITDSERAKGL